MPRRGRRGDVPQLPRDRGRARLHPRARPDAPGDARRRGGRRRLAVHRGPRRAGPLPVVQGVQARLPGRGRHGHLQERVPLPALPAAAAAAAHYALGWLPLWARLASLAPALANRLTGGRPSGAALRRLGGIAPARPLPRFAPRTLRAWWRDSEHAGGGQEVLLWVDTFTEHFTPRVGQAAVAVLEAAGFRVRLPDRPLCCGLTWLSTGQLGGAQRRLRHTLDTLEPALRAGTPLVVLEPSCAAVLRDDVRSLLGEDERVRRLVGATHTLAELLERRAPDWRPGPLDRRVVTQTHCHQHAVLGSAADDRVLERLGVQAQRLDAGCCGMAGNFGFEAGHYRTSVAVAELALLPALRAEPPGTVVLADGFSCRAQIEQLAGRPALHLAELLREALDAGARRVP